MTQAIEGIYRNGVIELLEVPQDIHESRVLITFLPPTSQPNRQSTEADFAIAEFHGDAEDGLDWS
jgi:hypothetical protein